MTGKAFQSMLTKLNALTASLATISSTVTTLSAALTALTAANRPILIAPRTYYVRADGNNANTGLVDSAGGAFQTWQFAINVVAALDLNGQTVTIQHGSEGAVTFSAGNTVPTLVGGGRLIIKGSATPGNTVFSVAGTDTWYLDNTVSPVQFQTCTVQGGSGAIISIVNGSRCEIGSGVIFGGATIHHIWVHDRKSMVYLIGPSLTFTISGNATLGCFLFVNMGAAFFESAVVTLTGTPTWVGSFVQAINGGSVQAASLTFSGAAVGVRYNVSRNGAIYTQAGGANFFPGNAPGIADAPTYGSYS